MPTYDYRCNACGHEFELFQQMSAKPKRSCPSCKKLKLERLIGTGAAVLFKGSGFYETDYRSASYKKAAEAEKPKSDSGASSKATDANPDAKPATEPKPKAKPEAGTKSKPDAKPKGKSAT